MATSFAGYPVAEECKSKASTTELGTNPVLRGLPFAVASHLFRIDFIAKLAFRNAGLGSLIGVPELDDVPARWEPTVTPLGPTDRPLIPFEPHLLTPKATDSQGRYHAIADYHDAYKSGALTPLQVVDTILPFISQNESTTGPYRDAWVHCPDTKQLVLEAAKASTERYRRGQSLGVLDGVPIGIKDDIAVQGWSSHWGMNPYLSNPSYQPQDQSWWPVMKLLEAGAVIVGKNRMHEMGSETSGCNPSQGTPTNHHNEAYFTGGSSSGGASAVSVGIVPFVLGTDAGGSLRIPAGFNGVYALKPSHSRTMYTDFSTVRIGPIAATVADLTIAYRLIAQPDHDCPVQGRFTPSVPLKPGTRRTIGICQDLWKHADPRVADTCRKTVDWLVASHGYDVVDIELPLIDEGRVAHSIICLAHLTRIARRHSPNPAAWLSTYNAANKVILGVGLQASAGDLVAANALRELLMRHLAFLFRKYPNLLILTPTTPIIGWPRYPSDEAYGMTNANISIRNMMYVYLANLAGTPSLSAPAGYVDPDQGEGKMPVGLMALAEWGAEEQLLGWATEVEDYLTQGYEGGRRRPTASLDVLAETRRSIE